CIIELIEKSEPLNVFLLGADPQNSLAKLDEELAVLKQQIEARSNAVGLRTNVQVLGSSEATVTALKPKLQAQHWHIFHFRGHGRHGRNPDESGLFLSGKRGQDDPLTCEQIRHMLSDRGLWLAYLSCCYGAATTGQTGIEQQYAGTIHAVLEARIP